MEAVGGGVGVTIKDGNGTSTADLESSKPSGTFIYFWKRRRKSSLGRSL